MAPEQAVNIRPGLKNRIIVIETPSHNEAASDEKRGDSNGVINGPRKERIGEKATFRPAVSATNAKACINTAIHAFCDLP